MRLSDRKEIFAALLPEFRRVRVSKRRCSESSSTEFWNSSSACLNHLIYE